MGYYCYLLYLPFALRMIWICASHIKPAFLYNLHWSQWRKLNHRFLWVHVIVSRQQDNKLAVFWENEEIAQLLNSIDASLFLELLEICTQLQEWFLCFLFPLSFSYLLDSKSCLVVFISWLLDNVKELLQRITFEIFTGESCIVISCCIISFLSLRMLSPYELHYIRLLHSKCYSQSFVLHLLLHELIEWRVEFVRLQKLSWVTLQTCFVKLDLLCFLIIVGNLYWGTWIIELFLNRSSLGPLRFLFGWHLILWSWRLVSSSWSLCHLIKYYSLIKEESSNPALDLPKCAFPEFGWLRIWYLGWVELGARHQPAQC